MNPLKRARTRVLTRLVRMAIDGAESGQMIRSQLVSNPGRRGLHSARETVTLAAGDMSSDSVPPSSGTGGLFSGQALPPTLTMPAAEHAWRGPCGHVNLGEFEWGDHCGYCWSDPDADVRQYKLVTVHTRALDGFRPSPLSSLEQAEKQRIRRQAYRATKVFPGPIGEMISRELTAWEEFGYRLGGKGLVMRLLIDIERREIPQPKPEPKPDETVQGAPA
jgi:hypothetical protein